MAKLFWLLVVFCITVWSGLCWLAYQLIGAGGRFAARNADAFGPNAEFVEQLSNLALWGTSLGEWAVFGVWLLGTGLTLALGYAASKLLGRAKVPPTQSLPPASQ